MFAHYIFHIYRGAFAKVYKGTNLKTGEEVAIKRIDKTRVDLSADSDLNREIEVMKSLNHPNVIRLLDIFDREAELDLVLELASGGELLDKIINRGNFSEADTIDVLKQVLSAVADFHSKGVVHRDLKPENLLCSGSDDNLIVKISDFGLSKKFSPTDKLKTIVGTPDYAAPEVLRMDGSDYTTAVDMWSIGVITYVLLTGFHPFSSENVTETFERIKTADYFFPDDLFKDISPEAKDFINRCLVIDPKKRITAAEALHHPWIAGGGRKLLRPTASLSTYMTKRRERN